MSKMIFNGLEFVAGQEINNNGVFIDTDNAIYSAFTFDGTEHSWTAISDCILLGLLITIDGSTAWYIKLNDIFINASYVDSRLSPLCIKKGQIIKYRAKSGSSMTAYGLQSGSVSNVQHNYSTSEQLIGTWIDGKPIYEKTISYIASTSVGVHDIETLSSETNVVKIEGIGIYQNQKIPIPYYGGNNDYYLLWTDGTKLQEYRGSANGFSGTQMYVTIQYTKTTD